MNRLAMLRWLAGADVVGPDGSVRSWHNAAHPGYDYPEAGGLLLRLLLDSGPAYRPAADRIATWLVRQVRRGTIGRHGAEYLFDQAVVLAGLSAHADVGASILQRLFESVTASIRARAAASQVSDRWSSQFAPHLLKVTVGLRLYADRTHDPRADAVVVELAEALLHAWNEPRAPATPNDSRTYLHAHCYAAEGLLALSGPGSALPDHARESLACRAHDGARWLAQVQLPGGGLPAWHDGASPSGPQNADVAAQAVRLWACTDAPAFADNIGRAMSFLRSLATPQGGLRYRANSSDINTWSTVFATQALALTAEQNPSGAALL